MTTQPFHQATVDANSTETRMTLGGQTLIRLSGLAAIVGGFIFAGIQPVHPADVVASVTTEAWAIIISLKLAMCLFILIGITGLYARQVDKAGWLGLVGFLLLIVSWFLQTGFVFAELFILPPLATATPQFVESFLGVFNGSPGAMDIGAIVPAYGVVGIAYLLGGLAFGIATVSAGVLPRWPAVLLALTALVTPAAALLPHAIQRYAAIPMGLAMVTLGYSLWSEHRRGRINDTKVRQLRQSATE
ncbi:MAG: hypothetical protein JWQ89_4051 [Devosia sp.]|uniref:hypothetical protein n=1 Tax=Devosia sp. TaxID=1871048 RepID=UPI00262DA22B|nr:hypothetical protein [Devosia sp.]MDB5542324.1 hypothetical protein [Devosia sp.]